MWLGLTVSLGRQLPVGLINSEQTVESVSLPVSVTDPGNLTGLVSVESGMDDMRRDRTH